LKRFLKWVFFSSLLLFVGLVAAIFWYMPEEVDIGGTVEAALNPRESAFGKKRALTVLLLGVDYNYDNKAQRHTKGARSDTILVLRVEPLGKSLTMMSLPRDLFVGIGKNAVHGYDRINAAHSYGGPKLAVETVEQVTGLRIDHFVAVKSDIVAELVDAIGGVPIKVEKRMDWDDNWAGLHIHLKPGDQILSGEDAVGYCRFRQDEEGDFGRIRRQQKFLTALLKELKRKKHWHTYPGLAKVVSRNMETDLKQKQLVGLAAIYKNFPVQNVRKGRPEVLDHYVNGAACLVFAPGEPRATIEELFVPLPNPAVGEISVLIDAPREWLGEARRVAGLLRGMGFPRVTVRNSPESSQGDRTRLVLANPRKRGVGVLREVFPRLPIHKEKGKGRQKATLTLRSEVYVSIDGSFNAD